MIKPKKTSEVGRMPYPATFSRCILWLTSLLLIALGQPAFIPTLAPFAAAGGLALFWGYLIALETARARFLAGCLWFTCAQLIQFSWMLSHPFYYIYIAYPVLSLIYGSQFGALCMLITRARWSHPLFP